MQNAGLLNSCNGIVTTGIQLELPILLVVYYAGDIGDRGFARVGTATVPVLDALGVRHYLLRDAEAIDWTFKNAWILAEDSSRPVAVLLTKDVLGTRS
jgi:sulfopyruvate decarboxylase TPP-binding subunit